jgi:hypothetical protein
LHPPFYFLPLFGFHPPFIFFFLLFSFSPFLFLPSFYFLSPSFISSFLSSPFYFSSSSPLTFFFLLFRSYDITIGRGPGQLFPWVGQWDEDEGANRTCFVSSIAEANNAQQQHVYWNISMP